MSENYETKLIGIQNGRNFRELGGYKTVSGQTIKYNKLLRTGNLADLSSSDLELLQNHGVKYDVDFRTEKEKNDHPDRVPEGAEYIFNPVFSDDLTNASKGIFALEENAEKDPEFGFKHMFFAYEDMINGQTAQKAYRKFFDLLLANDQEKNSLLFHCTAGKDRTGFGALLVLSALGVPFTTIKYDYTLTNVTTKDFVDNMLKQAAADGSSKRVLQSIKDIQTVYPEYLDHAVDVLNQQYGGINEYLRTIMKLSSSDIMDLRRIYLEDLYIMGIPKYLQIENELKKEIIAGKFKYGDKFYSEAQLKEKFNVSSITVIRSVKDLVKAGYLVRHQGKGTFISRSRKDKLVRLSDNEIYSKKQEEDHVEVLKLQEENKSEILEKLNLPHQESYYYIERLRLVGDTPFMLHRSYIPAKFINKEKAKNPDNYRSIYEMLQKDKQLYLFDEPFTETDSIVKADSDISKQLKIDEGYPVVRQIKKTILDTTGEVVELVVGYKRCDYFSLSFSSTDYPEI